MQLQVPGIQFPAFFEVILSPVSPCTPELCNASQLNNDVKLKKDDGLADLVYQSPVRPTAGPFPT